MKSTVIALGLVLLAATALASSATLWPAKNIKWVDTPVLKGAKMAVLWGDPAKGAYGALKSIPAGSTLAMHTHTSEQRVLVHAGTILLTIDRAKAVELGPGSYAHIPGNVKHMAVCKAGTDCVYFEQQPGASDTRWVK